MSSKKSFGGENNAAEMFFSGANGGEPIEEVQKVVEPNEEESHQNNIKEQQYIYTHKDTQPRIYKPKETKSKRTFLLFRPSLYNAAKERAEQMGVSTNELVSIAVEKYLAEEEV